MWKNTSDETEKFKKENKHRICTTMDPVIKAIDPQKIMAISGSYTYPEILNDYKMKKLIESVDEKGWEEKLNKVRDFDLLELPNGDLLVNGNGNHRAVLAKERKIPEVRANVQTVVYDDFEK